MDKTKLQADILEAAYNQDNWIEVLKFFFGAKKIHTYPQPIILPPTDLAETATELGNFYTADERLIGIYEVHLTNKAWIDKNRVGLRGLLRQVYKYDVDGALIVFVKGDKWRFSFVSEIRTEEGKKETEPKRYTYLFGEGEKCRTAADRFQKLAGKPIYLNDLYDAFSVEKLNKDFFKTYKEFYEKGVQYLASNNEYYNILVDRNQIDEDKKQKPIRDFVKKLLGRVVFLHFLQRKRWLGCSPDREDWIDGSTRFLQILFDQYPDKERFHSQCLKILFFETLNVNRKKNNDIAPESLWKGQKRAFRIPFLNGGLFDRDISYDYTIDFTTEYFKSLLDFFEQYNFTIDENDPYESEVGIDPEMLGHIFENLLEENRERGAFYTPKEIVHYMCQESLIEYLHTQMPSLAVDDIELLVRQNKVNDVLTQHKTAIAINEKLTAIKVCDPAIGSGAFPMGMLKEIFECRRLLYHYLNTIEGFVPAIVKKEIIQQNIYGVDVDPGAVDIARLRFWLALVVDEVEPQPLPNLDYKIMQGNSLLESFEGVDLSNLADIEKEETFLSAGHGQLEIGIDFSLKKQTLLVFDLKSKQELYDLIDDYYGFDETTNTKYPSKQFIKDEISKIVEGKLLARFFLAKPKIEKKIKDIKSLLSANIFTNADTPGLKEKKSKNLERLTRELKDKEKELEKLYNIIDHLHDLQNRNDKPYFLWHLWFKEVFEENGFDIVIGNPPYIQLQKMGVEMDILQKADYSTFSRTSDIYCLFYELGFALLRDAGTLSFITSNTWMRTRFGELLRKYFREKTQPKILLNFEDTKIFQTATVETNIIISNKGSYKNPFKAVSIVSDYSPNIPIVDYLNNNSIVLSELKDEGWVILSKSDFVIKTNIEKSGIVLKNWDVEFYRGMLTGFNDAFYIDGLKRAELINEDPKSEEIIKRLIRGREIRRWAYDFNDNYAIYPHNGLKENKKKGIPKLPRIDVVKDFPAIYKHLLQFKDKSSPLAKKNIDGTYQTLVDRTDQGDHWTNIRDCAYLLSLEEEKLVWLAITDKPAFAYDDKKTYVSNPSYFMCGKNLKYLLAFLNSKVIEWYMDKISSSTGQGTNQWNKMYIEQLPVPEFRDQLARVKFETLVEYLLYLNDKDMPAVNPYIDNFSITATFEDVLNMMVYEWYFGEHMKEQEIDVFRYVNSDTFPPLTDNFEVNAEIIDKSYKRLQEQDNPIRNRVILSNIRSKDIIRRINSTTH